MIGEKMSARSKTGIFSGISEWQQEQARKPLTFRWLEWRNLIPVLIISDLLLYYLAFRLAFLVRDVSNWPITKFWFQPDIDHSELSLLTIPVLIGIFVILGLYSRRNLLGGTREYALVFYGTTLGMFLNICEGFFFPDDLVFGRGWVIFAWLFSFLSISAGRFLIRRAVYRLRQEGFFQTPALIVGSNTEASLVADQLKKSRNGGLRVIGFVRCSTCVSSLQENLSCLGHLEDLPSIIRKHRISVIILISSALSREQVLEIFRKFGMAKDIELRISTGLYEIITTGLQMKEDGMVPLVTINKVRLTGAEEGLKAILDYCVAIPVALVVIPIFLVVAVLIKMDSPGPVIYLRRVMGVNGKQFNAYKFRTMRIDNDQILAAHPEVLEEYQNCFKIDDDLRATRLGQFLRKTRIDELPQILNVLKNEMSLVGPRMICPEELEKYEHWDINLLTVKPGLTGLWQVRGQSDVSYEERVRFDLFYIRNWTIWLDIQIIIQTIPAVLFRRGAY